MIKQRLLILASVVFAAAFGFGQENSAKPKSKKENTLLWKISGNGLTQPSYVFGTMHILCADDAKLSDSLRSVIKRSKEIYFEIDMDNMMELMGALKFIRMNDNKKISDLLSEADYKKVEDYFSKNSAQLPFSMMTSFKPYFITSMIGEQMMDCPEKNGMEAIIMKEAKTEKKEIKGLETAAYQASIFDSIPYDKQAKDLISYIDSIDNYKSVTQNMVQYYRNQDLSKLDDLMKESDVGMAEYMDILLYNRNRNWAKKIPGIMKTQPTLFAVGAGHLPGDQGVLSLLRKQGYKVTPVENKF